MAKDSKALKKMYLLSESTFQKIKDIEDAERNFSTLDKAMKSVLYNNKISNHKKLTDEVKRLELKNPFDFDKDNFPRMSAMFSSDDFQVKEGGDKFHFDSAPLNPNNFQFNHTLPTEEDKFDKFDSATLDQSILQNIQPSPAKREEVFASDGVSDRNVTLPPMSAQDTARKSIAQENQDVSMRDDTQKDTDFVNYIWKKRAYPVQRMFIPKFQEFLRKIEIKYPTAVRLSTNDFSNYIINGVVEIKSLENPNPFDVKSTIPGQRKRKNATTLTTKEAKLKKTQMTDHFQERKVRTATLIKPSKLGQVGKGLKNKWISFR